LVEKLQLQISLMQHIAYFGRCREMFEW